MTILAIAHRIDEQLVQELTKRYKPTEVPPCRVCGARLKVAAAGGGGPTQYVCSTQSATNLPADWEHYERSRWEDVRSGGDAGVMQLLAAYSALLPLAERCALPEGGVEPTD
jgi:hypothetical protein